MPIVILLILIVVILLGGAGLILGLLYGLFVLIWAALPWAAAMIAIMFAVSLLRSFASSWPQSREASYRPRSRRSRQPISDEVEVQERPIRTYVDPNFRSNAPSREERKRLREKHRLGGRRG